MKTKCEVCERQSTSVHMLRAPSGDHINICSRCWRELVKGASLKDIYSRHWRLMSVATIPGCDCEACKLVERLDNYEYDYDEN